MKFTIHQIAKSGARIGSLMDFTRIPDAVLETPMLLLHTRAGSVPHLSYDLLKMVTTEHHILQTPLATLIDNIENIKSYGKGIAELSGLKEYLTLATLQDPGIGTRQGYHEKNSVSIWTRSGRRLVDPATYMSCVEVLKPDVFELLGDDDTDLTSSSKRIKKSVDATTNFAKVCVSYRENSEILKNTPMFASISGGYSSTERLRCVKNLNEYEFDGYVLDGFSTNGPAANQLNWEEMEPILTETLAAIPDGKPRVFHGPVTPVTVIRLVTNGLDIFDATFPWMVAERGGALIFPNAIGHSSKKTSPTETLPTSPKWADRQGEQNDSCRPNEAPKVSSESPYEISLKSRQYFDDFQPLLASCTCYTCRKYSRAYIHHLLATSELLGPMLLMMHNLHHYLEFFRNIRSAIGQDQLEALLKVVESDLA